MLQISETTGLKMDSLPIDFPFLALKLIESLELSDFSLQVVKIE